MKQILIIIALLTQGLISRAQSNVPDCDTSKYPFVLNDSPCKVKAYRAGKFIGYTQRRYPSVTTGTSMIFLNNTGAFQSFGKPNYLENDTIPVIAYVMVNPVKPKFKWMHLYGIVGLHDITINLNGVLIYQHYLGPDRKTPCRYRVIYAINE